jgi:hypothetical protein
MSEQPNISVIVNFYNAEKYIEETIESIFAQTYDNWELLLVDDGAEDTSSKIALKYCERFPNRVRYLAHEGRRNLGASAARNLGIRQARGEHIALLDADDVWLPHKLDRQLEILSAWPEAAMLYGNTQYWHSWTGKAEDAGRDFQPGIQVEAHTLLQPPGLLARILRQEVAVPCTCSLLLRRAAVLDVGGFVDSFRKVFTDQAFYAKLLLRWPVVASSECWDRYRQHTGSCVSQVTAQGGIQVARLKYLQWLEQYMVEQGSEQTEAWSALQGELWTYHHPQLAKLAKCTRPYWNVAAEGMKNALRQILPASMYGWLKHQTKSRNPASTFK